jgi:hypothetical protein
MIVAGPGDHPAAGGKAQRIGRLARQRADRLGGPPDRREPGGIEARELDQRLAPRP